MHQTLLFCSKIAEIMSGLKSIGIKSITIWGIAYLYSAL